MNKVVVAGISAVVLVLGVFIYLFNTIWVNFGHALVRMFVAAPVITASILIIVVAGIFAIIKAEQYNNYKTIGEVVSYIAIAVGVVLLIVSMFATSFWNANATFNASTVKNESSADTLSFNERVPYDVANAVSSRSLGDTTGDIQGNVKAIPGDSEWTARIVRRGVVQGYESVQSMNLPLYGSFDAQNDVKFCTFDAEKAGARLGGGWFTNSLSMKAYHAVGFNPLTYIHSSDSFTVCDGETPMVYLPVVKLVTNGLTSYDVPAGVVTYNGKTGEVVYEKDMKLDGMPVYPQTVAKSQLHSLRATDGYVAYIFGRVGYETTSQSDSEDVNGSNNGDFSLSVADSNNAEYVTPLTPRGSSSSVIGLAQTESDVVENGKFNTLVINKYETNRQAPSTVSSNIVSGVLSGYKSSGLTVFEVIPSLDGGWTASIGKNQNILYRAVISADGKTELTSDPNMGNDDSGDNENVIENPVGKHVNEMTTRELRALADTILDELANRAEAPTE